jgi:hypothetical protein
MIYENNAELREMLRRGVPGEALHELLNAKSFELADAEFEAALEEVKSQHSSHSDAEARARAAYRLLTRGRPKAPEAAPDAQETAGGRERAAISKRFWTADKVWMILRVAWAIAILAMLMLIAARPLHAQQRLEVKTEAYRTALVRSGFRTAMPDPDVPGGIIIQVANQGTVLATRPAGLLQFNCSTNLTCSFSGTTFTMTASSSASTAWSALTAGTNSNAGTFTASGNTWDFTAASLFKLRVSAGCTTSANGDRCYDSTNNKWLMWQNGANKNDIAASNLGNSGQPCLSNADGSCTFADPIVSGPDAVGVSPTKNPVQVGCLFLTTPATLTNNQVGAAQCDATQNLLVKLNVNPTIANTGFNVNNTPAVTQSGNWTTRIVGNAGAAMDAAGQNASSPANALLTGCQFNTSPTTITNGNMSPIQCDNKANTLVNLNTALPAGANLVGKVGIDQTTPGTTNGTQDAADGSTGSAVPAKATYIGGNGSGNLTGPTVCDNPKSFSITANTRIVVGTAAKQVYICSINLVVGAATNVALVEGTGTTCGTGTAGMAGGTTAATGWNFAANGGLTHGTGFGWVFRTATTGDDVCLFISAANQTSGSITYTQY